MWSRHYDRCVHCGTVNRKHLARGLCTKCYWQATELRHKNKNAKRGIASKILTRRFLEEAYLNNKLSCSEIARSAGCIRQYVHDKLVEYGIPRRSLSKARELVFDKKKVTYTRTYKSGKTEIVTLQKRVANEDFFKYWSKGMAWVLGIVYTDGYIDPARTEDPLRQTNSTIPYMSIGQKEPELLIKVMQLMGSNAKLTQNRNTGCFNLRINSAKIYRDLVNIGVTTKKSFTAQFPDVPNAYLGHFIRGCWIFRCGGAAVPE